MVKSVTTEETLKVALKRRDSYEISILGEGSSWMMASSDIIAIEWLEGRLEIVFNGDDPHPTKQERLIGKYGTIQLLVFLSAEIFPLSAIPSSCFVLLHKSARFNGKDNCHQQQCDVRAFYPEDTGQAG